MNTIIIQNVDNATTALLESLLQRMGIQIKTQTEQPAVGENLVTNSEVLQAINDYENGKQKGRNFTLPELKEAFDKMTAHA